MPQPLMMIIDELKHSRGHLFGSHMIPYPRNTSTLLYCLCSAFVIYAEQGIVYIVINDVYISVQKGMLHSAKASFILYLFCILIRYSLVTTMETQLCALT